MTTTETIAISASRPKWKQPYGENFQIFKDQLEDYHVDKDRAWVLFGEFTGEPEPADEQVQNSDKRKVFSDLRRAVDPADFRNIFTEAQEAEAKRDPVRLWAAFQDYANGIATVAGATIHKELWSWEWPVVDKYGKMLSYQGQISAAVAELRAFRDRSAGLADNWKLSEEVLISAHLIRKLPAELKQHARAYRSFPTFAMSVCPRPPMSMRRVAAAG